jgi:hypothetical protein
MEDNTIQKKSFNSLGGELFAAILAPIVTGLIGIGLGMTMARIIPEDKFSWAGLAVLPLWFIIEIIFELIVGIFGSYSRITRILVTSTLIIGFYITWFSVRFY